MFLNTCQRVRRFTNVRPPRLNCQLYGRVVFQPHSIWASNSQTKKCPHSATLTVTTVAAGLPVVNDLSSASDSGLPAIIAANETFLYTIHNAGLPWWATIVTTTCLLRSCLTLPTAIYQQRNLGKMINLAPIIQSWAETLKVQIAEESRRKGDGYQQYQRDLQKQYRRKVNQIYAHYGCSRWKVLLLPWVQIPLFISMSLALRDVAAMPLPWFGVTSTTPALGLSTEGIAWFTDLTAVDSTMIAPFLIGFGNLFNVELNAWFAKGNQSTSQKVLTNAFRVLSLAFIPISAHAPMALGLYWLTSTYYSVIQNIVFKIPSFRTALKLPQLKQLKKQQTSNKQEAPAPLLSR